MAATAFGHPPQQVTTSVDEYMHAMDTVLLGNLLLLAVWQLVLTLPKLTPSFVFLCI